MGLSSTREKTQPNKALPNRNTGEHDVKPSVRKTIVIGFDGLDPTTVIRLLDHLPHFKQLIENGIWGYTVPDAPMIFSPILWTNFMTGKKPEKHGIVGLWKYGLTEMFGLGMFGITRYLGLLKRYVPNLVYSSNDIQGKMFFEILSDMGQKVAVINIPMTYPPRKVNGILVSGFMTPIGSKDYCYPRTLVEELEKFNYEIDVHYWHRQYGLMDDKLKVPKANIFRDVKRVMDKRKEVALHLMSKNEYDFFMVYFKATDSLGHLFWDKPKIIERVYGYADTIISDFIDEAGETNIFVLSDHGMQLRGDISPSSVITGTHTDRGLWLSNVLFSEERVDMHLIDFAPTFLHLFGQQVPEDIDGKPLPQRILQTVKQFRYTKQEEEEITQRLKRLGYI